MSNKLYPDPVVLVATGVGTVGKSPAIKLTNGVWELEIYGGTWDGTAAVNLQQAGADEETRYVNMTARPAMTNAIALTSNPEPVVIRTGGTHVRLYAADIGDNDEIALQAKYIGPAS